VEGVVEHRIVSWDLVFVRVPARWLKQKDPSRVHARGLRADVPGAWTRALGLLP
jgi:hypothetical protein